MKAKFYFGTLLIIAALITAPMVTQAQSVGKPAGNTLNFFDTNFTGGLLGHREQGSFGTFNVNDQWIGIGQPVVSPFSSTKVPAYGLRAQWQTQTGIFALKSANSSPSIKDLAVEWGSNPESRLRFSFIKDQTNPSSLVEIMTMTPQQKVGINNTAPFANLDVTGVPNSLKSNIAIRGLFSGSVNNPIAVNGVLTSINSFNARAISGSSSGTAEIMYGGIFSASNSSTTATSTTYGIFASVKSNNPSNAWAGYFNGDVYVSGSLTVASDRKFKENINVLEKRDIVSKLMKLTPSSYNYKSDENMSFTNGMQFGFIAQDVEKVFPSLVKDVRQPVYRGVDEAGNPKIVENEVIEFKSVNYLGMVPILTKAIQEHETTISDYESKIANYETRLNEMEKKNEELTEKFARLLTAIENNRSDLLNDVVEESETSLGQNEPNPFGQSSRITYTLASTVKNAAIHIYNMDGKKMGEYQLDSSKNEVQIAANTYEPGVYIYALIADGKTIGTRRMIVSK